MLIQRAQSALLFTATLLASLFISNTSFSTDNSIYITQSGNNTTVTMSQDGAGNVVRGIQGVGTSNTTPASIVGNTNTVTVSQIGTGNILDFGVNTAVASGGTIGGNYSYSVTGNNAVGKIDSNNNGNKYQSMFSNRFASYFLGCFNVIIFHAITLQKS